MVNTFSLAFLTIQKSLMMREPHLPESKRRQAHRQTDRQARMPNCVWHHLPGKIKPTQG